MAIADFFSKRWRFNGGLPLPSHKRESTQTPVVQAALPERLILPLQQHIGAGAKSLVEVGQRVRKGQTVAKADGYVSAYLHAPSSGTVTAIDEHPVAHPAGLWALCIIIATDGEDRWDILPPALPHYSTVDPRELRQRVRGAGIVGLGGAAFPSAVKLNPGPHAKIHTLILNGAECEPYISCDDMLMRERPREIINGALIMTHALQCENAIIALEDDKPEAYRVLIQALAAFDAGVTGIEIRQIPTRYPSGGEKQLIQLLTGREAPSHGIPPDIGMVCHNVGTAAAIHDAIIDSRPLISRYVTVTGQGVRHPRVLEVLLGTPVSALIAQCGGYTESVQRLIMGGPMMGFALKSDDVPVTKGSNCFIAASAADIAPPPPSMPCIRCGACAEVCPAKLLPQQLYWHARAKDIDKIQAYHLFDCIECGCCAAVCPSRIPLVHYYRFAKTETWAQERERQKADIARHRHEFHQARLDRDKQIKEAKLRNKKEALQRQPQTERDPTKAAIAAAVARANAKKTARVQTATTPVPATDAKPIAENERDGRPEGKAERSNS